MIRRPAKMAKPIEMPFRVWTQVGLRNHVLDVRWGLDPPHIGAILKGKRGGPCKV